MTDIKTLLPQRDPFLFVQEIRSATYHETVGTQTYGTSFPLYQELFPQRKTVPGVILLESLVQCGGAGITQLGLVKNALWSLAAVSDVQFYAAVEAETTVKMVVKNLKISQTVLKQAGKAFCRKKIILEATWLCLRMKTNQQSFK